MYSGARSAAARRSNSKPVTRSRFITCQLRNQPAHRECSAWIENVSRGLPASIADAKQHVRLNESAMAFFEIEHIGHAVADTFKEREVVGERMLANVRGRENHFHVDHSDALLHKHSLSAKQGIELTTLHIHFQNVDMFDVVRGTEVIKADRRNGDSAHGGDAIAPYALRAGIRREQRVCGLRAIDLQRRRAGETGNCKRNACRQAIRTGCGGERRERVGKRLERVDACCRKMFAVMGRSFAEVRTDIEDYCGSGNQGSLSIERVTVNAGVDSLNLVSQRTSDAFDCSSKHIHLTNHNGAGEAQCKFSPGFRSVHKTKLVL
jgi:hypothetical protein